MKRTCSDHHCHKLELLGTKFFLVRRRLWKRDWSSIRLTRIPWRNKAVSRVLEFERSLPQGLATRALPPLWPTCHGHGVSSASVPSHVCSNNDIKIVLIPFWQETTNWIKNWSEATKRTLYISLFSKWKFDSNDCNRRSNTIGWFLHTDVITNTTPRRTDNGGIIVE